MVEDRIRALEEKVEQLGNRVEDDRNQREAMAALPDRVGDLRKALEDVRQSVGDFRDDCKRRFDALTREKPDGSIEVAAAKLDLKTLVTITALIVVPIVVAIISR